MAAFAVGYALTQLSHLAWMPLAEYPSTLAAAEFFATAEEVLFRGYLLGRLLVLGMPACAGNLLAAALFVLAHPRYLADPHPQTLLLAAGAAAMSLLAGAVALRYRNAWGAVVVHAGYDLLIFVPLAEAITSCDHTLHQHPGRRRRTNPCRTRPGMPGKVDGSVGTS